jgi:hypothetical protein
MRKMTILKTVLAVAAALLMAALEGTGPWPP